MCAANARITKIMAFSMTRLRGNLRGPVGFWGYFFRASVTPRGRAGRKRQRHSKLKLFGQYALIE